MREMLQSHVVPPARMSTVGRVAQLAEQLTLNRGCALLIFPILLRNQWDSSTGTARIVWFWMGLLRLSGTVVAQFDEI